jgi:hypothetical protein
VFRARAAEKEASDVKKQVVLLQGELDALRKERDLDRGTADNEKKLIMGKLEEREEEVKRMGEKVKELEWEVRELKEA